MEDFQTGPPGELFTEAALWAASKQLWDVGQGREDTGEEKTIGCVTRGDWWHC